MSSLVIFLNLICLYVLMYSLEKLPLSKDCFYNLVVKLNASIFNFISLIDIVCKLSVHISLSFFHTHFKSC